MHSCTVHPWCMNAPYIRHCQEPRGPRPAPQHAFRRDGNGPRPVASLRGGLGPRGDQRPLRIQTPNNRLSTLERQRLLAIANSAEFRHLPPSQIVPRLADRGQYVASESTFNRILKAEHQLRHRGVALGQPPERPGQPRSKPRALSASAPNELFSWDITYLPTSAKGLYF